MSTTPPTYTEEEINQALASVYALLLRAARRKRLAEAQGRGDEGDACPRKLDD